MQMFKRMRKTHRGRTSCLFRLSALLVATNVLLLVYQLHTLNNRVVSKNALPKTSKSFLPAHKNRTLLKKSNTSAPISSTRISVPKDERRGNVFGVKHPSLVSKKENYILKKSGKIRKKAREKWIQTFREKLLRTNRTLVKKSNTSAPINNARISTSTCYRQIQFWMGPKEAAKPTEHPCPGVRCGLRLVHDTSLQTMQNSDAVVLFHRSYWDWDELHRYRPLGQKWLFYTVESPLNTRAGVIPPAPYYSNSYDYTVTYRHDSTFIASYGYYDPTEPEITDDKPRNWAGEKSGLIAWMSSNCETLSWKRVAFVKALSKHIQIDMYGACGNLKCPRNTRCTEIIKTYKFYLALENSECRDYITEKFWINSLQNGVVPVVYGTIKEDYQLVAPPNSFIHLHDFTSLAQVADYLHTVASNDTLYNSFLEWKGHGSIKFVQDSEHLGPRYLCKVVARLLEDEDRESAGVKVTSNIQDLNSWWTDSCNIGFPKLSIKYGLDHVDDERLLLPPWPVFLVAFFCFLLWRQWSSYVYKNCNLY